MDLDLLKKTYDRVSAIAQCSDFATICEMVDQIAYSVGASSYALVDFGTRDSGLYRVVMASPNSRYTDLYSQLQMDRNDPVPGVMMRSRRPVTAESARNQPEGGETLSRFMAEVGMRDFVVVPIFKNSNVVGGLSFHFSSEQDPVEAGFVAGLVAPTLFDQMDPLAAEPERTPAVQNPLTPRELECLIWSADGKTSWEISEILEVSERTVNAHLGRAIRKLGVVSRTQAVAEAIRRGFCR